MSSLQFFIVALTMHLVLLSLFSLNLYIFYFLALFISLYLLSKHYNCFSPRLSFILLTFILIIINLNIYDEYLFELFLWLDILDKTIYINSEVSYILMLFHLLLLINLKRFDSFWDIIDEKLFNRY